MNKENPPKQPGEISIELTEEVAEGTYTNLSIITHSSAEFIFDFIRMVPNVPKAKVKSRILMSPQQAKRLSAALNENIRRYEAAHGVIKDLDNGLPPFPMNFNTPKGQA